MIRYEYKILFFRRLLGFIPSPTHEPVTGTCYRDRLLTVAELQQFREEAKAFALADLRQLLGDKAKGIHCEITPPVRRG